MKIVIVGAGINGVTAALELTSRGHKVTIVDPGPLPHPLAASTDISKAVRAAYGVDEIYAELAERSIPIWRKWNIEFKDELYHEVGFLFMRQREMQPGDFEYESFKLLERRGHKVERVDSAKLRKRFSAWNAEKFRDGFFEVQAGYAESGRVVNVLVERAKDAGVKFFRGKFARLEVGEERVKGVVINANVIPSEVEGSRGVTFKLSPRDPSLSLGMTRVETDAVVMATGAWTPYVLPFTSKFFRATGQSVFHLRPTQPELFAAERFPVFGADITSTGYYGFPLNRDGVVKIANHGPGREMSPDSPDRFVTAGDEQSLRAFLAWSFPALADAEIAYTRVCFYCDTHDGNFWIAPDPDRRGLVIAAGDCGHGFKFAPALGEIIADVVEAKENRWTQKFRWRPEVKAGVEKEAARRTLSS